MFYEIKIAGQIFRNEGLTSLINRSWRYIFKLPRYLLFALQVKYLSKHLDLKEWVDMLFTSRNDLIRPLQVRSEILKLLEIIKLRKSKYILEIGTSNGGTLFLFTRVASDDACIISIDLPLGPYGGGYPSWKIPFFKSFAKDRQKIFLLRLDSHLEFSLEKIKSLLAGKELDLLFIDGDHSYEGVKTDFHMYKPLVRKEGLIIFHDIVPVISDSGCQGSKFWNEVRLRYETTEIIENNKQNGFGLGIVVKS